VQDARADGILTAADAHYARLLKLLTSAVRQAQQSTTDQTE